MAVLQNLPLPACVRGLLLPAGEDAAEAQLCDGLERGHGVARHVEGAVEGHLCSSRAELLHDTSVHILQNSGDLYCTRLQRKLSA